MKRIVYVPLIITQVFFLSCKKYLDEPTTTSLGYPTTVANCQALLDNSGYMNENRTPSYLDASCDDYFYSVSQFNSEGSNDRAVYLWDIPDLNCCPTLNDWAYCYYPIYHANVCLENIDKIEKGGNVLSWNNVKGSAFFFRAYYFLQLAWEYSKGFDESTSNSDLGIVLKKTTDLYETNTRSSVKQTYDQILSDAKQSLLYLPDTSNHPLRPSKVAAYGLLARTYLSMRIYDSAGIYADKYLALKNRLIDFNGDPDLVNSFTLDISPFRLFNSETIFYTSKFVSTAAPNKAYIDSTLYSSYANDDLRKQAFFAASGAYKSFKGSYSQNSLSFQFSGIATDEMYLIRAECNARNGNKDNALTDLNSLLSKRWKTGTFVPITAASSEQALQIILQERRKELLMRGLRWTDLKRLNKEPLRAMTLTRIVNGQTYTLPPNDNRYALPIPQPIIAASSIHQNPR